MYQSMCHDVQTCVVLTYKIELVKLYHMCKNHECLDMLTHTYGHDMLIDGCTKIE